MTKKSKTIFSVDDLSVWDVFPIEWLLIFLIPLALIAFPNVSKMWPFSTFVLFGSGRSAGTATLAVVAVLLGAHFGVTYFSLESAKRAYQSRNYETFEGDFGGEAFAEAAFLSLSEGIVVGDKTFAPPGSLHGIKLTNVVTQQLDRGETVIVKARDGVFFSVELAPDEAH